MIGVRVHQTRFTLRTHGGSMPQVRVVQPGPVRIVRVGLTVVGGSGATGTNFVQALAASVWVINHNLGYRPAVQTFTTGGLEIGGTVLHLSLNQTTVTFKGPLAGTARLS